MKNNYLPIYSYLYTYLSVHDDENVSLNVILKKNVLLYVKPLKIVYTYTTIYTFSIKI